MAMDMSLEEARINVGDLSDDEDSDDEEEEEEVNKVENMKLLSSVPRGTQLLRSLEMGKHCVLFVISLQLVMALPAM